MAGENKIDREGKISGPVHCNTNVRTFIKKSKSYFVSGKKTKLIALSTSKVYMAKI